MVFKYIILVVVIYGIYRFTTAPKIGPDPNHQDGVEDEYTDYEEVE